MPLFIDTAYVIARINRRDQYHEQARVLAHQYVGQQFIVTDGVLLETGNALARHFRAAAIQLIEQFLASPQVEVVYMTPDLFASAITLYKQMDDKQWSLVDCASFVVMRERGITEALTSDHHFTQAGFKILLAPL
jgi:predicted nucleic acid-binding protein